MNLSVIFLNAASPVITEPKKEREKNETRVLKLPAQLKRELTYYLKYYSWTKATTVSMQKKLNNTKKDIIPIEVIYSEVIVSLPVFSHSVTTKGNQAIISLYIDTEDDFGIYENVVSNVAGTDVLTVEVVPEGMYSLYQNVISTVIQYPVVMHSLLQGCLLPQQGNATGKRLTVHSNDSIPYFLK